MTTEGETMSEETYQQLLEKVREELREGLEKKKDRVLDLAKKLERDGVNPKHIARQVAHDLDDIVSKDWVYKTLGPEYKEQRAKSQESIQVEKSSITEIQQEDGTVLLGGGPSLDDPEVRKMLDEYKKTRDEDKLLQDRIEELQIKWKSICPEHQRAITDCKKCGEKA